MPRSTGRPAWCGLGDDDAVVRLAHLADADELDLGGHGGGVLLAVFKGRAPMGPRGAADPDGTNGGRAR